MSSTEPAYLFPGQGAQARGMLDGFAADPGFDARSQIVWEVLGDAARARFAEGDDRMLQANRVGSLLTVVASRLALDRYEREGGKSALACAGYSVGQWTALHAAGVLGFEELVWVVERRARLMDECANRHPGGMVAVIGLAGDEVEDVCDRVRAGGRGAWIANYNCVGQCTVAAEEAALAEVADRLERRSPKKLVRVPVAGAWHSPLLEGAVEPFRAFLDEVDLRPARLPVIDNVDGSLLPLDAGALRDRLALQLREPVRWERGVRTLIARGCGDLVELGYGGMLTKFGFFIDRSVRHRSFPPAIGARRTAGGSA